MVIVVALTAITSFLVPPLSDTAAVWRLLLLILATIAGIFGIMLGTAAILTHLCSLRSFGVPYTSPIAPANYSDMKDVFVKVPWWAMFTRPRLLGSENHVRHGFGMRPKPPEEEMKS
jgi:spore germination protein KA